jgi:hypothetical protein
MPLILEIEKIVTYQLDNFFLWKNLNEKGEHCSHRQNGQGAMFYINVFVPSRFINAYYIIFYLLLA